MTIEEWLQKILELNISQQASATNMLARAYCQGQIDLLNILLCSTQSSTQTEPPKSTALAEDKSLVPPLDCGI